jgi:hypothetical protein
MACFTGHIADLEPWRDGYGYQISGGKKISVAGKFAREIRIGGFGAGS